jgi:hypothetical protein
VFSSLFSLEKQSVPSGLFGVPAAQSFAPNVTEARNAYFAKNPDAPFQDDPQRFDQEYFLSWWKDNLGQYRLEDYPEDRALFTALTTPGSDTQSTRDFFAEQEKATQNFFERVTGEQNVPTWIEFGLPGPNSSNLAKDFNAANATPPALTVNPTGGQNPVTAGSPATSILTGLASAGGSSFDSLMGPTAPPNLFGGGTLISPTTIAPTTTTINYDASDRSSVVNTYNSTTTINESNLISNILSGLKGFFGTPQSAANATPSNDAAFTNGMSYPGMYSRGQTINAELSTPSSPSIKAASVSGIPLGQTYEQNKLTFILVVIGVVTLAVLLFKRGRG